MCPNNMDRHGLTLPVVGIFNVSTDVDVWDCTRGCMDTARDSALAVDSGRKIPCCTKDLNPHHYWAWRFNQTLYQLSVSCPCTCLCLFLFFLLTLLLPQKESVDKYSSETLLRHNMTGRERGCSPLWLGALQHAG